MVQGRTFNRALNRKIRDTNSLRFGYLFEKIKINGFTFKMGFFNFHNNTSNSHGISRYTTYVKNGSRVRVTSNNIVERSRSIRILFVFVCYRNTR